MVPFHILLNLISHLSSSWIYITHAAKEESLKNAKITLIYLVSSEIGFRRIRTGYQDGSHDVTFF
jgi:hypothetical protein